MLTHWSYVFLALTHRCVRYCYNDVIMSAMTSQITSFTVVYSTFYSGADKRKHQRSVSLAFVRGINRWPMNSPHKGPVTQKMFPFDDVIMIHHIFVQGCDSNVALRNTKFTKIFDAAVDARISFCKQLLAHVSCWGVERCKTSLYNLQYNTTIQVKWSGQCYLERR